MFEALSDPLTEAGVAEPAQLADCQPTALVAAVESSYRLESILVARRLAAVAGLLRHRVRAAEQAQREHGYEVIDGFEQATAEVAAAMNLSPTGASYLVCHAEALDTRLPKVAVLLAGGRTDWRTVRLIISRTELITDQDVMAKVDESLATRIAGWHSWSKQRIVNAVDSAVRVADPDAVRERRSTAENERFIAITAKQDGMAEMYGSVAATAATAFDRRLSQLAKQVCPADPRTLDQRRADALAALTEGRRLACQCGLPECPSRLDVASLEDKPAPAQIVVTVIASEQTIAGKSDTPGYLEGYGVIDAEQLRELAATAAMRLADPETSAAEALRYQPSAALERAIRCRDLTCRFPGCGRPATRCDLDHTIPFNHDNPAAGGATVASNLKCLCRQHHRLKTFGNWRDRQLDDGTVIWTSPTGQTYRTAPAGVDLFPSARAPSCAPPPPPTRRTRSKQRNARIAQRRKQNCEQKRVNEVRRMTDQAREAEIADRKFRNHMRDMLVLFKGKPSTSPFCTWVNDPREPEVLPPDWKPANCDVMPQPDDPPF